MLAMIIQKKQCFIAEHKGTRRRPIRRMELGVKVNAVLYNQARLEWEQLAALPYIWSRHL